MKLKAPVCLLVVFFCEAASAQILVGPTAGPQISWMSYDDRDYLDTFNIKPHVGFHAGFNLSFRVRKRFFLHTSFVYSTKGGTVTSDRDPFLNDKFKYNYIEIPMMYTYEIKMRLGQNKEFKWYLGLGPNVSYWLNGKGVLNSQSLDEANVHDLEYKYVFHGDVETASEDQLVITDPNRIQLGLNFSGGFVFEPVGFQKIMVTIRYEMGHSFLSDYLSIFPGDNEYYSNTRSRTNGVRVSLAYLVDLKTETRKKGKSTLKKKNR